MWFSHARGKRVGVGPRLRRSIYVSFFVRRGVGKSTKHKCPCRCLETDELREFDFRLYKSLRSQSYDINRSSRYSINQSNSTKSLAFFFFILFYLLFFNHAKSKGLTHPPTHHLALARLLTCLVCPFLGLFPYACFLTFLVLLD